MTRKRPTATTWRHASLALSTAPLATASITATIPPTAIAAATVAATPNTTTPTCAAITSAPAQPSTSGHSGERSTRRREHLLYTRLRVQVPTEWCATGLIERFSP